VNPYAIKTLMMLADWAGRALVFGRDLPRGVREYRNIPYGPHFHQRLDVLRPRTGDDLPGLVWVHGGGWTACDKASFRRVCRLFAVRGFCVVSANYRLAPRWRWPTQARDVAAAVAWAAEHLPAYGGDPAALFVGGDSAGGQLAAWYAAAIGCPELFRRAGVEASVMAAPIRGALLFYGVYDFAFPRGQDMPFFVEPMVRGFLGTDRATFRRNARDASPLRHVSAAMPPCFICAGEPDPLAAHAQLLAAALAEQQAPVETLLFGKEEHPESGHAFLQFPDRPCAELAVQGAVHFMRRRLAEPVR
jgi:acetyl esterase/lipase